MNWTVVQRILGLLLMIFSITMLPPIIVSLLYDVTDLKTTERELAEKEALLTAAVENMAGGLWDTLLALVWTQYQYIVFPAIFGIIGYKLLMEDWRHCFRKGAEPGDL